MKQLQTRIFSAIAVLLSVCFVFVGCELPKRELTNLTFTVTSETLEVGDTTEFDVETTPTGIILKHLEYQFDDTDIVTINQDEISAVGEGTTTVSVSITTEKGKIVSNKVSITVTDPEKDKLRQQAQSVSQAIGTIGEVTLDSEPTIAAAREKWNELPEEAKQFVTNSETLTQAETALQSLKDQKAAEEAAAAEAARQQEEQRKQQEQQAQRQQPAAQQPKNTPTAPSAPASTETYILNTNTKKFHRSSCGDIKKMKDSNKATASSREEAIAKGYSPCKHCNP